MDSLKLYCPFYYCSVFHNIQYCLAECLIPTINIAHSNLDGLSLIQVTELAETPKVSEITHAALRAFHKMQS